MQRYLVRGVDSTNFSSALLIFTGFFALLFFVFLALTAKAHKKVVAEPKRAIFVSYQLITLTLLTIVSVFKTTWLIWTIYPIVTGLHVFFIRSTLMSDRKMLLFVVIMTHLAILSLFFPSLNLSITERSAALAKLASNGSWDPTWRLVDAYYKPLPIDLGLYLILSETASTALLGMLTGWIIRIFLVVAYDIVLYWLIRILSGSWRAGILGVLLLSFTPPAVLSSQPQGLASIMVLMFMLVFFKMLLDEPKPSYVLLANLLYVAAIFMHGTAALIVVVLVNVLFVSYFIRKIGKISSEALYKNTLIRITIVTLCIITLIRWIDVAGVRIVLDPLKSLVVDLLGFHSTNLTETQYVPLSDQYMSPIQAYAWSMPISMALAYTLYHFVHRKNFRSMKKVLIMTTCIGGGGLLFTGLVGGILAGDANLQRYLGYSSFFLFFPAASIVGLRALRCSAVKISVLFFILMILFSGIAIGDPEFSPQLYANIETVRPAGMQDYLQGKQLYDVLSSDNSAIATYEIRTVLKYLSAINEKQIYFYSNSLKTDRALIEGVENNEKLEPKVVYVWSSDVRLSTSDPIVDITYSSGTNLAFEKAGS